MNRLLSIREFRTSRASSVAATLSTLLGLVGCGGGGGGAATTAPLPVTAQTTSIAAAQAAVLFTGGQDGLTGTRGAAAKSSPHGLVPIFQEVGKLLSSWPQTADRGSSGWIEDSTTGLYFETQQTSSTTGKILLSTNGTSNNAGYIGVTLVSGGNGSYPTVDKLSLHLNLSNQTITGTDTLTQYDNSGLNFSLQGSESSSSSGVSASYDVTVQNGGFTLSLTLQKGSMTFTFDNVQESTSSPILTAEFTDGGVIGTVSVNADGSGQAEASDSTGKWTLNWDASDNATLTSPSGQVTTGTLSSI